MKEAEREQSRKEEARKLKEAEKESNLTKEKNQMSRRSWRKVKSVDMI